MLRRRVVVVVATEYTDCAPQKRREVRLPR
jgi:hypothetical protein